MTKDEETQLKEMPTEKIRRNYHLCQSQIEMCKDTPWLENAANKLMVWQSHYLDELVERGEKI